MIEKTAWDVRKYPEKFAVYRILCNFAVVFQNCINSMEAKYIHRELSAVIDGVIGYKLEHSFGQGMIDQIGNILFTVFLVYF